MAMGLFTKKPLRTVSGQVTNKRQQTVHARAFGIAYYVTIGTKELLTSAKVYNSLSVGSYVSASYKRGGMFDTEMLIELL